MCHTATPGQEGIHRVRAFNSVRISTSYRDNIIQSTLMRNVPKVKIYSWDTWHIIHRIVVICVVAFPCNKIE